MQCSECGIEAEISGRRTEVQGDQSPDTETVVETVLTYICRNPSCGRYHTEIGESRHRLYPEEHGEPAGDS